MNQEKIQPLKESGHVLALVVSIIAIVTLMAMSLLTLGLNSRTYATRTTYKIKARCAADAGLTKALFEMNEKLKVKPWDDSTLPYALDETLPNFDGVFSCKITKGADNTYIIESVGKAGAAEKRVSATIELESSSLFDHAILTKEGMDLYPKCTVDGYNSKDPGDTDVEVKIGTISITAGKIILKSNVVIDGDVVVGVGGDVDTVISDQGAATGDRYAMTEEPSFPKITPPVLPYKGTNIQVKGGTTTIGPADSGEYSAIDVSKKGALRVSGGDVELYITGGIDLGQGCEIFVTSGATLKIYVDGDIEGKNDSSMGGEVSSSVPMDFQLYATGAGVQDFDLKAKSDWCGVIYAPNANIGFKAKGNCYGAIVADDFEAKAKFDFYYDEQLRTASASGDSGNFVVKRWSDK